MKTPRLFAEFVCDGIACERTVQVELPIVPEITEGTIETAVAMAGCRLMGRNTFFCPECPTRPVGRMTNDECRMTKGVA